MSANETGKVLIFDIEGTDSKEHGDDHKTFEQTLSLFAMSMADVLMVNMWTQNIGNYQAGNYALLKVIFEINLKLFEKKDSKRLLFVLRDFNN